MKTLKLFFAFIIVSTTIKAQKVGYSHDAHGNRTQRKLVVGSSSSRSMTERDSTSTFNEETMKLAMQYGVSVFPNPAQSNVNITANKIPTDGTATATLFDNSGKILQTFSNISTNEEVPMTDYKAGIYYLSITVNDKDKLFYKIVKQ